MWSTLVPSAVCPTSKPHAFTWLMSQNLNQSALVLIWNLMKYSQEAESERTEGGLQTRLELNNMTEQTKTTHGLYMIFHPEQKFNLTCR